MIRGRDWQWNDQDGKIRAANLGSTKSRAAFVKLGVYQKYWDKPSGDIENQGTLKSREVSWETWQLCEIEI